jgi:hypothetical protein
MTPLGPRAFAKNQDGFNLRFFNTIGAGAFNPCFSTTQLQRSATFLAPKVQEGKQASEKRNIYFRRF